MQGEGCIALGARRALMLWVQAAEFGRFDVIEGAEVDAEVRLAVEMLATCAPLRTRGQRDMLAALKKIADRS